MVIVCCSYLIYVPWGTHNPFNVFATMFRDWVDVSWNVPFLGFSWFTMFVDVQQQLFVCFTMYALFVYCVNRNYIEALRDWKTLDDTMDTDQGTGTVRELNTTNVDMHRYYDSIIKRRVSRNPKYKQLFKTHKMRLNGVDGFDGSKADGWHDFKLHLYFTDVLGKSVERLVEVTAKTHIALAVAALVIALLAHHYQVAFMYFLPGFVTIAFLLFISFHLVSKYFVRLSDKDDHTHHSKWVTVHSFCRTVQIVMYCLFYSFSRLLLSPDIFEFYPKTYLAACIGIVVILGLIHLFAGHILKETVCALALPPHADDAQLE